MSDARNEKPPVIAVRNRFLLAALFWLPTFLAADLRLDWPTPHLLAAPGCLYLPPLFGTAVYVCGGWVFVSGAVRELRDGLPGMMTLIALAIGVGFASSVAALLGRPGKAIWWELSTLVVVLLLGYWIDLRSEK